MALTVKTTPLKGAGGYTTTTPTLKGSAGALKPMGGGQQSHRKAGTEVVNQTYGHGKGGRKGEDKHTTAFLKNQARTIVP